MAAIFFQKLHESTEEASGTAAESSSRALGSSLHAKAFLEENFTQVAERVGFADPFHFSRVFKRMHGIAPAAFQRMHKRTAAGNG